MHSRNTRFGLILFGVYLLFYGGFVFLNAVRPASMEATYFGGLNLAILYGLALIVLALVLAVIYGLFAAPSDEPSPVEQPEEAP